METTADTRPRQAGARAENGGARSAQAEARPAITDAQLRQAEARMAAQRAAGPCAASARHDRAAGRIVIALQNGVELSFAPHLAPALAQAGPDDLDRIEVAPSGLGLHFPRLDADLYLPALLAGVLSPWAASLMGKAGGARTSTAKAAAARANGCLGGRPRKQGGG